MQKVIIGFLSMAAIAIGVVSPWVMAEDAPSDAKMNIIRVNCVAAQSTLQRVGRNDTTARINRGRDYDAALKLFYAMNSRVAAAGLTVPRLAEITKNFETELANFRDKYNGYNGDIKSVTDINCTGQPANFYQALDRVRGTRASVNASIVKLDRLIENYKKAIKELAL